MQIDGIQLVPLTIEDAGSLQEIFERAADYFQRLMGKAGPDADAAERELGSIATQPGRQVAAIRDDGGSDLGAIGWWSGSPEPQLALLGMILVVPEARGRGVASSALAVLEARLRKEGIERLRTAVGAADGVSLAFLEAIGFTPLDQSSHVDMDGGRLRIAFFEKSLHPESV